MNRFLPLACMNALTLVVCLGALGRPPGADQLTTTSSADTPQYMLLQIEALARVEGPVPDSAPRRQELINRLHQVPALVARFDASWPEGQYRPRIKSLLIDALGALRNLGDPVGSDAAMTAAARELRAMKADKDLHAKAEYTLLSLELNQALKLPASQPATSQPTSQPTARDQALLALAGRYVALSEEYRQTPYAPLALYSAALLVVRASQPEQAGPLVDKLASRYPNDPAACEGLGLLVQLHTQASQPSGALAARRRLVAQFPESQLAAQYRAEIARTEAMGKESDLRFQALDGSRFNVRDHRGKMTWAYFFLSASTSTLADKVAKDLARLQTLAAGKAVIVAIGADDADRGGRILGLLRGKGVACPIFLDDEMALARSYGVQVAPSVVVIDPAGKLAAVIPGPDMQRELAKLATTQPK